MFDCRNTFTFHL
ncbi:hypothetical protein HZS_3347 [Henneguya salminicola]|nr:hypothetical protein HZS_3347 [Henneguya salminicola]